MKEREREIERVREIERERERDQWCETTTNSNFCRAIDTQFIQVPVETANKSTTIGNKKGFY